MAPLHGTHCGLMTPKANISVYPAVEVKKFQQVEIKPELGFSMLNGSSLTNWMTYLVRVYYFIAEIYGLFFV